MNRKNQKKRKITTVTDGLNEIDNLFDSLKTAKVQKTKEEIPTVCSKTESKRKNKSNRPTSIKHDINEEQHRHGIITSSHYSILNPEAPLERIDKESGLPVYKAHLLKVGKGGGTDLCPFDCNCCF